jgi:hypothetical protein
MNKRRLEKAFIGTFLAIVIIACASILVRFFAQEILTGTLNIHNGVIHAILFDLQSDGVTENAALEDNQDDVLSPFYVQPAETNVTQEGEPDKAGEAVEIAASDDGQAKGRAGIISGYTTAIEDAAGYFKKGLTNWATDYIAGYKTWVSIATGYNKALHWSVTPREGYNSVVFLPDGYLATFTSKQDMTDTSASILEIKALADELDIDFLYVQYPFKICKEDPESGTLDYSNQNADRKLGILRENDAAVLDLRDAWHADGNDNSAAYHRSAFYVTDHHWRAETGLWAAGTIAAYMNEHFGFQIDLSIYEPDQYQYDVYENRFLGSYGRQATLTLVKPEDFTLVYPKFETSFHFPLLNAVCDAHLTTEQQRELEALYDKERALNGSFEMFFDYSMLEAGDYYDKDTYCTYTDNLHDLVYIHNNLVNDGKKVLFLRDSFGRACVPFFALGIEDTMRIRPDSFGGSWEAFFATEVPDVIVMMEG